ncbi:hypothetical protein FJTKL_02027 [Diaporthe vaccinii]|uniref:beta-glucosidase n=1 Tax=Diaporthe vaccinii TaxID=105482 RepID=A0ABR4DZG9_9PEZI
MKASLLLFLGAHAVAGSTASYRRGDNGTRDWDAAAQIAQNLVSQLTLDEKVQMITGNNSAGYCISKIAPVPRLNFTGLCMLDGPNAVNRADLGKGGHVALGPTTGPMGRHALGGRNWEGFGPDPYLAGISITESINGLHDAGVQASTKHYIANEQDTQRSSTINVVHHKRRWDSH